MNEYFRSVILQSTGASSFQVKETIQELWSGYGKINRLSLSGGSFEHVIVKHVQLPKKAAHPRGWDSDLGHQRKITSYQVESTWYEKYSRYSLARLPKCLAVETVEDEVLILLEDLDEAGFAYRKDQLTWKEFEACLKWLAQFHASYLGKAPKELWPIGTYWHLATRPQELNALTDHPLKEAAPIIDKKLNNATYQTFVHGDAKLGNFCFGVSDQVAGVDFQYVGGGCGIKDVAYFVGSCLNEQESERLEEKILNTYFQHLQNELNEPNHALENEWRSLYRLAWADFHRFLKGWSPSHWKINSYSERVIKEVIKEL